MISTNPSMAKSHPRMVYTGIKQGILGSIPYETTPLPQHLAHIFTFTERGKTLPQITTPADVIPRYGKKTIDQSQPFYTHASAMTKVFTDLGQTVILERLQPPNAKTAMLRLSAELVPAEINLYSRAADGKIIYVLNNTTGLYEPTITGTALGWRVVIHKSISMYSSVDHSNEFGRAGAPKPYRLGDVVSSEDPDVTLGEIDGDAQQSNIYALFDLEVASFGSYGDKQGVLITAPNTNTSPTVDLAILRNTQAFPFVIQCVEATDNSLIPTPIATLDGDESMQMILKENIVHPTLGTPMSFGDSFVKTYGDPQSISKPPGPFGRAHVYQDNINELLDKLINGATVAGNAILGEKTYYAQYTAKGGDVDFRDPANMHMLNFLTGIDHNDIPYYGFDVSNSAGFGGLNIEDGAAIYASGGDDGLIKDINGRPDTLANLKLLDDLVAQRATNYGILGPNMLNLARYPASAYWDSGFSIDTKKLLMTITSKRKDVVVITGIHRVADMILSTSGPDPVWGYVGQLTELETASIAADLYSAAQLVPESTIDGTGACRIAIVRGQSAPYDPRVRYNLPMTFDVAFKAAQYMGNSNGNWDGRYAWDDENVKIISYVGDLDDTNDLTEPQQERLWDKGTCYPVYIDDRRLCWPMLRTVHNEPTSPLVALEFVFGCTTAVKEAHRVWIELCGSNLDENQFVERSNAKLAQRLNSQTRFAGKFTIEITTEITASDRKRRYSWQTVIVFKSGPYRTVNKLILQGDTDTFSNAQAA